MASVMSTSLGKVVTLGGLSGFLGAWLLAIELAAIQGARALRPRWILVAPWDPEIRPFTLAITLAAVLVSLVWYAREAGYLRPHPLSLRWYVKTVGWGLACLLLSIALILLPSVVRGVLQMPAYIKVTPLMFLGWGAYGFVFGLPIVLVFSPVVVWIAEQIVLRSR